MSLGQFPAGTYEVEVVRVFVFSFPLGIEQFIGSVGTVQFTVAAKAAKSASPQHNYTDLWWNPAESGWGLGITHHPSDVIFATWYTYGADGKPMWYVIPNGQWSSAGTYSGPIFRTVGPALGGVFNPANVVPTQAGTGTMTFTSYDEGTFTYTVDGISGTRAIRRQGF